MGPRLGIGKGFEGTRQKRETGAQRGEEMMNEVGGRRWRASAKVQGRYHWPSRLQLVDG